MTSFDWNKEATEQWDNRAAFWNERSQNMWENGSRSEIIPFINNYFQTGGYVLDIGCGDGYGTYKLYEQKYQAVGLDISANMINYARAEHPSSIEFLQGNVNQLPFKKETFDGVMAINSLEWTENPKHAIKEIKRVVKQGGWLCIGILGPTAGPRINSYPRLHMEKAICNTMMPWEFEKLCEEMNLSCTDGFGVYKQGVTKENYAHLTTELKQALSFSWIFMLKKAGES
ncbi:MULTISPECIES: class I SAM-dependent methyltransferase [Virgibacillus]|uniref:Demethylrebeccamycin-D-glucose O-methyltransferase n=2 Tax=Virgibacillus TaxID=84406 RepID=A0A024QFK3_9BACI|nr:MULTISPECIES: class I SAM-dependent methyltransferase [Virgibacillus]EQB38835.1 hypothetical protein M948_00395 [Virgibacillus sp. CM-4]MYL43812.1 methyltransferase domain-containing protein [Virgibacillus massiliensis]GGJ66396.1 methyltransferase [Virgibacillus kapii]CDQ40960.1 Demethylrebeccamycin-D-glucose O-methyltransferase [Virgibacillus massiliensis]